MSDTLLNDIDYQSLAALRRALRQFIKFSTDAATAAGLEAQQYQALLAIRARPGQKVMTVGDLADELLVRHHSAVELVTRLAKRGLVERHRSTTDRRQVMVQVTGEGRRLLDQLAAAHKYELRFAVPVMQHLIVQLTENDVIGSDAIAENKPAMSPATPIQGRA